jgi:tripartite-type tricarboxylate transporter receptor subunit TctC
MDMPSRRSIVLATLLAALSAVPAGVVFAQSKYPNRPIEFIITFAPGGPTDTAIRLIQPQLAANLGVPVVLTNKAGAGGALGTDYVAKAKADGYTIAATVRSTLSILPAIQEVPYKTSDFAIIGSYAADSQAVLVKGGSPWKTLEDLVDYAKKNPGKLTYASAGMGTNSFFNMELIKLAYELDIAHVPFQGSGPVKNAILGGHVQLASAALGPMLPLIRSGDLVALVTTAPRRIGAIQNVPTLAEKGLRDASLSTVMELYAPVRTPPAVIDRLVRALDKTMKDPSVIAALDKAGLQVEHHDPETSRKLVEAEFETVSKAVKKLDLKKK